MLTENDLDRLLPQHDRDLAAKPLAVPTVHMNGDSRETLERDNRAALEAVQAAMAAHRAAAPNGRNFYVQADGAFEIAAAQHRRRETLLAFIEAELTDICLGIME